MSEQSVNFPDSTPKPAPGEATPALGDRVFALIPCAGQGSRAAPPAAAHSAAQAGLAKQYRALAGQPIVAHSVQAFRALGPVLAGIWVVVSPEDDVFEGVFPGFGAAGERLLRAGGSTRAATVQNGLQALLSTPGGAAANDWVMVHDAARCLVTPEQIASLMSRCQGDAVGGLLAQPLADTLKAQADSDVDPDADVRVQGTLERAGKWLAQTPQMFRAGALLDALQQAEQRGLAVTDESSAMEAMGLSPRLVRGSALNFKITYPEDFALAEAILRSRQA